MTDMMYYIISGVLVIAILFGIFLMSKVKTAKAGNIISATAMILAIVATIIYYTIFANNDGSAAIAAVVIVSVSLLLSLVIGFLIAKKVKMIQMPETVALFNGLGGAASAIVGGSAVGKYIFSNALVIKEHIFEISTGGLALTIGLITLVGSAVAAMKLAKMIKQNPVSFKFQQVINITLIVIIIVSIVLLNVGHGLSGLNLALYLLIMIASVIFGWSFSVRVGGADMPITISLLNSLSGVAGAISGMAIGNVLLVAVGGIVGASGLVLTQIMCKAMNRSLIIILLGNTTKSSGFEAEEVSQKEKDDRNQLDYISGIKKAKNIIIVPGYGMAVAQAQHVVKQLEDKLEKMGINVKYAIHPVAGRMPGHMNVLLAEASVDYDKLYEMEDINPEFKNVDLTIVIGANDVINPAANTAINTPIYGMPILNVSDSKNIIIMNYDDKPGYAGVNNPIYTRVDGVALLFGNALDTVKELIEKI